MNKLGKLIKHNETRFMFQKSNSLGDQIITVTDYDHVVVKLELKYEGDWFSDIGLDALLKEATDLPVIIITKLRSK